jgi:hypothetical protein
MESCICSGAGKAARAGEIPLGSRRLIIEQAGQQHRFVRS